MRKGLQGLTGGAEGLLHQAHLHHLRGERGETSPTSTTHCPSAPSPSHSPPRRAQTSGRSPHRGCARKKKLLRGRPASRLGDPRAVKGPKGAGSWPPGPSSLPSLPWATLSPPWQRRAHYTRRRGVGPCGAGRGLACREGSPAPLWGPRLLCTGKRNGTGRTHMGWGGREGGRARQRHSKHEPIPDIKIKIETSLPWVPETKRRER